MKHLEGMIIAVRDVLDKTEGLVRIGVTWYYAKVYRCGTIIRVDLKPRPDLYALAAAEEVNSETH